MVKQKLSKHNERFMVYNIVCILLSILVSTFFFMFAYGWAKGDGNDVSFTSKSFFIIIGVTFGFYVSMVLPGYLIHKILVIKDKHKN